MPVYHLHRLTQVFPKHGSAQDIVAGNQLVKIGSKGFQPFAAVEAQQPRRHIGIALFLQPMVEENALLQWCQRVDILNIVTTAGHCRFDGTDLFGIELNQRQHLGLDCRATIWNAVGRDDDLLPF